MVKKKKKKGFKWSFCTIRLGHYFGFTEKREIEVWGAELLHFSHRTSSHSPWGVGKCGKTGSGHFFVFLCYSCIPVSCKKGKFKIGRVWTRRQRIVPAQEASQALHAGRSDNKPVTTVRLLPGTSSCKRVSCAFPKGHLIGYLRS